MKAVCLLVLFMIGFVAGYAGVKALVNGMLRPVVAGQARAASIIRDIRSGMGR